MVFRKFRVDDSGEFLFRCRDVFEEVGIREDFTGLQVGVEIFVGGIAMGSTGKTVVRDGHARESAIRRFFKVREHFVSPVPFGLFGHIRDVGFETDD